MAKIYYDSDCDQKLLDGKTIGVVGFGSQGHAHAQNLRDSGLKVTVAEAEGTPGWKAAKEAGFRVVSAAEMTRESDIIIMLAPDQLQREIYLAEIQAELKPGKVLMFAHGFNIHYGQIVPPSGVDVTMVAPKCPGHMLRQVYTEGAGAPAAFDKMPALGTKARCLVTGDDFTVRNTTESSRYKGKYYVFCCGGCKPLFDANPEKYINSAK